MYVRMIQGIITVFGLCLTTVSPQMSFQQARLLSSITSIEQLFRVGIMRSDNGTFLERASDVIPQLRNIGDRVYVGIDMPELARPDECMPRLTTVEIPREPNDDINLQLWPRCTRIKRCGGCCANNMLKCVPKTTAIRQFMVLEARLWNSESPELMMEWEGYRLVHIQEHTTCDIVCRITAEDCNIGQRFYESECQCRCRHVNRCHPLKRWDSEMCRCVCKNPNITCLTGTTFNPRNCRCRITRVGQTYATLSTENRDNQYIQLRGNRNLEDYDPCAPPFYCPRFFNRVARNGGCFCNPSFNFRGRSRY